MDAGYFAHSQHNNNGAPHHLYPRIAEVWTIPKIHVIIFFDINPICQGVSKLIDKKGGPFFNPCTTALKNYQSSTGTWGT